MHVKFFLQFEQLTWKSAITWKQGWGAKTQGFVLVLKFISTFIGQGVSTHVLTKKKNCIFAHDLWDQNLQPISYKVVN